MHHRLRELRRVFGWTQADVADRSGVSLRCIVAVERGHTKCDHPTRRKLLKAFGMGFHMHRHVFDVSTKEGDQ